MHIIRRGSSDMPNQNFAIKTSIGCVLLWCAGCLVPSQNKFRRIFLLLPPLLESNWDRDWDEQRTVWSDEAIWTMFVQTTHRWAGTKKIAWMCHKKCYKLRGRHCGLAGCRCLDKWETVSISSRFVIAIRNVNQIQGRGVCRVAICFTCLVQWYSIST